ncbi:hypothetical protein VNO77_49348 [Canavalia gladiata]|uniref:Uncharacterized protein n=1 Tax=Canavalia gladiata TaxID=3824 RepID=A0AAN9PFT3_CANGL
MLTGLESKWGTYLPPVSISCQVCSPDIDYVQGSTLGYNITARRTVVHWSAGVRRLFPSWKSECGTVRMIKKKKCLVSLEKPTQINIIFTLSRPTSKDR